MRKFIEEWNFLYPLDRVWRQKYKVPFNSQQHRDTNFIDMYMDLYEDIMYKNLVKKDQIKLSEAYTPGNIFKERELLNPVQLEHISDEKILSLDDLDKFDDKK